MKCKTIPQSKWLNPQQSTSPWPTLRIPIQDPVLSNHLSASVQCCSLARRNKRNKMRGQKEIYNKAIGSARKSTANKSQTQSVAAAAAAAARKCPISISTFHFQCCSHCHCHFCNPRTADSPRGVFSCCCCCCLCLCCRWQFSLALPLGDFSPFSRFFFFCLFFGRVRAKIRKILFCLLFPGVFFFLYFFFIFLGSCSPLFWFRSFFPQHQISGFQFQCRIKVAACYLVGGTPKDGGESREWCQSQGDNENRSKKHKHKQDSQTIAMAPIGETTGVMGYLKH